MNIGAISSYVALICLLTFLALSGRLHAQTAVGKAVSVQKAGTAVPMTVGIDGTLSLPKSCCQKTAMTVEINEQRSTDGEGKHRKSVIAINREGQEGQEGQPRTITVERTIKDGKETVTVNGKEVDPADDTLPEDVQQLLEGIDAGGVEGKNIVMNLNSSEDGASRTCKIKVFGVGSAPSCSVMNIDRKTLDSMRSTMVINMGDMKQRCEEMKVKLGDMRQNMHVRIDSLRTHVWTMREGDAPTHFRFTEGDSATPRIFVFRDGEDVMKFSMPDIDVHIPDTDVEIPDFNFDFDFDIPDAPVVKRFNTDDLGEVQELFETLEVSSVEGSVAPEAVHRRYQVIIIEHPGHDEIELKADRESDVETEEPASEPEQPNLPSSVDDNTLRAEYFNVFPNPTPGALNISFALEQTGPVTVTVTDLLGSNIFTETLDNHSGQYHRQIDLTDKARGTYIVSVERGGQRLTRQVAVR